MAPEQATAGHPGGLPPGLRTQVNKERSSPSPSCFASHLSCGGEERRQCGPAARFLAPAKLLRSGGEVAAKRPERGLNGDPVNPDFGTRTERQISEGRGRRWNLDPNGVAATVHATLAASAGAGSRLPCGCMPPCRRRLANSGVRIAGGGAFGCCLVGDRRRHLVETAPTGARRCARRRL